MYSNPLEKRYASRQMTEIFTDEYKYRIWRRCWIALAESEKELGIHISSEQIKEMKDNIDNIDLSVMEKFEKELRHDLMAGVHCFAEKCPLAAPIIHLGATSCDITDNSELIQIYNALKIIRGRLLAVIKDLYSFANRHKKIVCLGYTHFQPAQPTTIGKRACIWLSDLILHLEEINRLIDGFRLKGVKGATGTQDSYLKLFNGDRKKVSELDKNFCKKLGFDDSYSIVGQTYPRIFDCKVLDVLKNICISAHKFASDFRLMQHLKMMDEPFEKKQIGSSAMAYKKNPMRSERICSLARFVMAQSIAADNTASQQWFERTLDDSAGRRIYISQSFMAVDAILIIFSNIISGAIVHEEVIKSLLNNELPFMSTETIIMESVKKGGNRQKLHEIIRKHSVLIAEKVKQGKKNKLLEALAKDPEIPFKLEELEEIINKTAFHGISIEQTIDFLKYVKKIINDNRDKIIDPCDLKV